MYALHTHLTEKVRIRYCLNASQMNLTKFLGTFYLTTDDIYMSAVQSNVVVLPLELS